MNISSYNVTDVAYHYIGLRVLADRAVPKREDQMASISRAIAKYVGDRALRLMLAAPRGTFETVGKKVCQELVHLQLARSVPGAYELNDLGTQALALLNHRQTRDLRLLMIRLHTERYDNFRSVLWRHIELGSINRPVVEAARASDRSYITALLRPTFGTAAAETADRVLGRPAELGGLTPKKLEDALREEVLAFLVPATHIREPLFRALMDRMNSLRLINIKRQRAGDAEFAKTYSPCLFHAAPDEDPISDWRKPLALRLPDGTPTTLLVPEPDAADPRFMALLDKTILAAFEALSPEGGYYDIPDVRDWVSEQLLIPEAAFDEGLNASLDRPKTLFSVGLQYERISWRRRPLVRQGESVQIYNLIRRQ